MKEVYDDATGVEKKICNAGMSISGRTIEIPKNLNIGIKTWGMIDYLCHYCGFNYVKTGV